MMEKKKYRSNKLSPQRKFEVRLLGGLALLAVILLVATIVLTCLSIGNGVKAGQLQQQNAELQQEIDNYKDKEAHAQAVINGDTEGDFPYQTAHTDMYAPLPVPDVVQPADKTVYLTFDDGPSDRTGEILDILKQYDAKATFFVLPKDSDESNASLKRISDEGNAIGVHTFSHEYKQIYTSVDAYLDDFAEAASRVKNVTGKMPEIFRFPGGSINAYNMSLYQPLIAEMLRRGYVYYDWNVDSTDAAHAKTPASEIVSQVISGVGNTSNPIVLMHDANEKTTTAEALPSILQQLKDAGYSFGTLDRAAPRVTFTYKP